MHSIARNKNKPDPQATLSTTNVSSKARSPTSKGNNYWRMETPPITTKHKEETPVSTRNSIDDVIHDKNNEKQNIAKSSTNNNNKNLLTLSICAFGICFCYLSYGVIMEHLFKSVNTSGRPITSFLLLTQTITNVVVAFFWLRMENSRSEQKMGGKQQQDMKEGQLNYRLIFIASFCYFAAMTGTNESLNYVSYPTATLAKSSKLIPTMIMGLIVERKSYARNEWLGALLISLGITLFNHSRINTNDDGKRDSPYGLALLAFSLAMDGFLGSFQSMLKRPHNGYRPPRAIETMLLMNLFAIIFICPMSLMTGQFTNGFDLVQTSREAVVLMWLLNLAAASGQIFIFFTIHIFSPLMCTTITTTRKFMTICLSVLRFGHVFSLTEWGCVGMVFSGIYLEIMSKTVVSSKKSKKD